jgi:hypothetical protein
MVYEAQVSFETRVELFLWHVVCNITSEVATVLVEEGCNLWQSQHVEAPALDLRLVSDANQGMKWTRCGGVRMSCTFLVRSLRPVC